MAEVFTTQVSAFGRFADGLTGATVPPTTFAVAVDETGRTALKKPDGYFVLTDHPPATYSVRVTARPYRSRTIAVTVPAVPPVEVTAQGEDEIFVALTATDAAANTASFAPLPFTPRIRAGALVFGEGGFSNALQDDLEGTGASFVTLGDVTGLAAGQILRIRRSTRLILQPGPYYPFEAATVIAIRVVENTLGDPPIEGASLAIDRVDGNALATVDVGGVSVRTATLASTATHLVGPIRVVSGASNARGDAVFDLPAATPIASVRVTVSRAGFVTQSNTIAVTAGERTSQVVKLDRV